MDLLKEIAKQNKIQMEWICWYDKRNEIQEDSICFRGGDGTIYGVWSEHFHRAKKQSMINFVNQVATQLFLRGRITQIQ